MTTKIVPIELDMETLDRLAARGRETGEDETHLAQRLVEEGIRMERHPGIVFRDGPVGRRPALLGGPDVWEVVPIVHNIAGSSDDPITDAANWLGIPPARMRAAMSYYAEYTDEIDAWITRNERLATEMEAKGRSQRTSGGS
jgi:hypothetical protein